MHFKPLAMGIGRDQTLPASQRRNDEPSTHSQSPRLHDPPVPLGLEVPAPVAAVPVGAPIVAVVVFVVVVVLVVVVVVVDSVAAAG